MTAPADLAAGYRKGGSRSPGEAAPTPAELADAYVDAATGLRDAVAGMTREQLAARPVPGRMSTLEVVCHLSDFEPIFVERFKRILSLDEPPLLLAADEERFLAALRYHDRDVEEELTLIEATRRHGARLVRGLKPEELTRTGVHNLKGLQTLEQVIRTVTGHIPHHLPFILEKRKALGLA